MLIFFVILLNWVIFEAMPGLNGNLYSVLGQGGHLGTAQYNAQVRIYGLNQPYWVGFVDYIKAMLTFSFGYSTYSNRLVVDDMIATGKLVNTVELLGVSTLVSIIVGVALGIYASHKRGSSIDNFAVSGSLTTYALPTFFIGIVLIFIFADSLNFASGGVEPTDWTKVGAILPSLPLQILIRLQYLFLPALTLTLFGYGGYVLLTRATMTEALSEDYIVTARAKGLTQRAILLRHAFKNASLPIITSSALAFGSILSGAIITETIFNWDGLGLWLYNSVLYKDYPVMQAMFYIIGLCVIAANFLSDILYGVVDPRIKYE